VSTSLPSTTTTRYLSVSHSYRFRVRAVDRAGNSSPWAYSSTFRVSAYQDSNTNLRYAGTWGLSTNSIWWDGKARFASRSGATVRLTFTGRSFAWVGLRSPYRGRAQVYVNGVLKATVDLKAATTQTGRLVWAANWSSSATRTVLIKVLGTSGRPRVDIDGFATIR
jgi:hypothetical protein